MAMTDRDLQRLSARLDARQAELVAQVALVKEELSESTGDVSTQDVQDSGDQGERLTRETVRHAEQERDAVELGEIADAKARVAAGTYGECVDCGVDIPLARLEVKPEAARCIACQEAFERDALV